jgi:putative methyltransferase (TIGR04325 family)
LKISQFIPPIVLNFISKLIKPVEPIWAGTFKTWEEASKQCSGYDDDLILEKCKVSLLKVKNGEAAYERDSVVFDEIQYNWTLLAYLQKIALENSGKLCVLDFGGSLGSTYYQNKDFLSSIRNLSWCIVEQPNFVKCGKEYFEEEKLKFYYTLEECLHHQHPNVLLLSSVMQYLDKPYEWLEKFISLDIQYIIIDRTAFVQGEIDLLTVQKVPKSIYNASYPSWFFAKGKFINALNKYNIVATFDSGFTSSMTINNNDNVHWSGIILKK